MIRNRPLRLSALLVAFNMAAPAVAISAPPERTGSEARRLYDKGIQCMDGLERPDCAIDNFEALLDVDTQERALVTDALMRLIDLYQDNGRASDIAALQRRFWDVGMKRDSHGHVPYSTRFIPSELNMLFVLDSKQFMASGVITALNDDARDTMLTCDAQRRKHLDLKREFRRAEAKAKKDGGDLWVIAHQQRQQQANRRARRAAESPGGVASPVFIEAVCPVLAALKLADLRDVGKMMGAMNHHDARQSIGIAEIPNLGPMLANAEKHKRLHRVAPEHWTLPDFDYEGGPVHVLKLDHDELTIVPEPLAEPLLAARKGRTAVMNKEVEALIAKVPRDSGFFFVMTQAALKEMTMASMKRSTRAVLDAVLPQTTGLQVAAVFSGQLGLFTRIPTETPGKGRMLVNLFNAVIARSDGGDGEEDWQQGLDIAESQDRESILASYLISSKRLQKLMMQ